MCGSIIGPRDNKFTLSLQRISVAKQQDPSTRERNHFSTTDPILLHPPPHHSQVTESFNEQKADRDCLLSRFGELLGILLQIKPFNFDFNN